jgi:YfiH family protein
MQKIERGELLALRFDGFPTDRLEAIVSTRDGGVSTGAYASLNLGLRVDDDPAVVQANRRRFFEAYDLPLDRSVWCKQVHADGVTVVDEDVVAARADGRRDRGALDEDSIITDTDALVTNLVQVPLCVTLADCVPVILYDAEHHAVGLAHAGWGGTVSRIASRTVQVMRDRYGTSPNGLLAAIGPSIAPDRYEVGEDVIRRARDAYREDAERILREEDGGKALFDLWEANVLDLESVGIPRERVEVSQISTVDNLDVFYSHRFETRGEHKQTGRFVASVMLRGVGQHG